MNHSQKEYRVILAIEGKIKLWIAPKLHLILGTLYKYYWIFLFLYSNICRNKIGVFILREIIDNININHKN